MLLLKQLNNLITAIITLNVIIKTIANDTPSQHYFLNVALSGIIPAEESVKKDDGLDSFCNWVLLYFHLEVNKMSFFRVSVKKQERITEEGGKEVHRKAKVMV